MNDQDQQTLLDLLVRNGFKAVVSQIALESENYPAGTDSQHSLSSNLENLLQNYAHWPKISRNRAKI